MWQRVRASCSVQRASCVCVWEEGLTHLLAAHGRTPRTPDGRNDQSVKCWDLRSRSYEPIMTMDEAKDSISAIDLTGHEVLTPVSTIAPLPFYNAKSVAVSSFLRVLVARVRAARENDLTAAIKNENTTVLFYFVYRASVGPWRLKSQNGGRTNCYDGYKIIFTCSRYPGYT